MKAFQVIRDPKAFKLLADETRRKILYLLRVKEMSVSQLADELDLTPQALYHYIKKLLKGEMVEVVREERSGHLIESYYRATAEDFLLTTGKTSLKTLQDRKIAEEQLTDVLNALKKIGFTVKFDKEKVSQLAELRAGITHECCKDDKKFINAQDKIWNMDELNLVIRQIAQEFVGQLLMSDAKFAKQQETREKVRKHLLSLIEK